MVVFVDDAGANNRIFLQSCSNSYAVKLVVDDFTGEAMPEYSDLAYTKLKFIDIS